MANRYKSVPKSTQRPQADCDCWDDAPFLTDINVPEWQSTPTGILDADGNEIHRIPRPIGFVWDFDKL